MRPTRKNAISFALITVLLDSAGLGIILPVLPDLIQELTGEPIANAARWGGYLTVTYALMQFIFGPLIGNLSDRFGRRPVLITALAIMAGDYLIMALAPVISILFIGRAVAGITGATFSTANAYIADISPPEKRAQNFGMIGAAFGFGFILGPLIGGVLGEWGTRAPFYAAAILALCNCAYGYFVFPESLSLEKRRPFRLARANPFGAARQALTRPVIAWLLGAVFLFQISHFVFPATWSFFTKEAFGWSSRMIGISLAVVGVGFVFVQGYLIRIILPRFGQVKTALAGFVFNIIGLTGIAFATGTVMIFALMPFSALGAMVMPALNGLLANQVPDDAQGELQGMIAGIGGLTAIISPLLMTQILAFFIGEAAPVYFPGAPYLTAAALAAIAIIPFSIGLRRGK